MIGFNATHQYTKKHSQLILFRQKRFVNGWISKPFLIVPVMFASSFFITAVQAAPATPSGVRIDVYSETTLEVFWNRANTNTRVSGYELNRNGSRLWLGDVTSYFDAELSPGVSHSYSVVAVDENGERSSDSRVVSISDNCSSSSTSGSSSCTSVSFAESQPSNGGGIGSIEGVSMSIYSNSAAELFWKKNNQVASYDVYRDNAFLQRTDGQSFFDSSRSSGYDHQYKIVAIGFGGNQLGAVTVADEGTVGANNNGSSISVTDIDSGIGSISSSSSSSSTSTSTSTSTSFLSDGSYGRPSENHSSRIYADVYSASAGEIFWNTNTQGAAKYDVYRNGHWVATTNGRSFYDAGLNRSSYYEYTIYKIENGSSQLLGSATIATQD